MTRIESDSIRRMDVSIRYELSPINQQAIGGWENLFINTVRIEIDIYMNAPA